MGNSSYFMLFDIRPTLEDIVGENIVDIALRVVKMLEEDALEYQLR